MRWNAAVLLVDNTVSLSCLSCMRSYALSRPSEAFRSFNGPGALDLLSENRNERCGAGLVGGTQKDTETVSVGPVPGETEVACLESGSEGSERRFGRCHGAEHMTGSLNGSL